MVNRYIFRESSSALFNRVNCKRIQPVISAGVNFCGFHLEKYKKIFCGFTVIFADFRCPLNLEYITSDVTRQHNAPGGSLTLTEAYKHLQTYDVICTGRLNHFQRRNEYLLHVHKC